MSRIAVTGFGLVGHAVAAEAARRGHDVLVASRTVEDGPRALRTELPSGLGRLAAWRPDLIVHTAAETSVQRCEDDPVHARAANVESSEAVAALGVPVVGFSTDWVFDGRDGGYAEDAPLAPQNVYGATKAAAEQALLANDSALVVRGTFLGRRPDGRSGLVERLLDPATGARVPDGKTASPLWVGHAAAAVLDLAAAGATGVVHIGSRDAIDWVSLAHAIRAARGLNGALIPLPFAGPPDTSLDVSKAERLLGRPLPSVAETVSAMVARPPLRYEVNA